MADRIRRRGDDEQDGINVYDSSRLSGATLNEAYVTPVPGVQTTVVAPTDRVRWGPVLAGLFATLTSLVVLSVLGLAVGLASYDVGEPLRNFGLGAGIWGAVSTVLAFLIGGWLAARSAATTGRGNGALNGAMVWIVAIPLVLYLVSSGLGSLLNTAGNVAATGITAAVPLAGQAVQNATGGAAPQATVAAGAENAANAAQATATALANQVTPQTVQNVAENASTAAWSTLIGLLIGLAAAIIGGLIGARTAYPQTAMRAV